MTPCRRIWRCRATAWRPSPTSCPGAAAALGVPVDRGRLPGDPLDLATALGGPRRVAVLLIDGLGSDLLRAHADLAPTLSGLARPVGDLSGPCPSTTPVSLATLGTGLPPAATASSASSPWFLETGATGEDRLLNHVQWRDDPDPDVWQRSPTVFEQAEAAGVRRPPWARSPTPAPGSPARSTAGAEYPGSVSHGDLVARVLHSLAAAPRALVYGYIPELDLTGHVRGVDSAAWRAQLALVDRLVEQLVDGLPDDAALLVTADHGMLDVPADTRVDLDAEPALTEGVRVLAGEPRARYVHTEAGAEDDVLARWRELLGRPGLGGRPGRGRRQRDLRPGGRRRRGPHRGRRRPRAGHLGAHHPAPRAGAEPAGRLPRLAHRDRTGHPAAHRPRPRADLASDTCQMRECAGWVARQVSRAASVEGRLSTSRPRRRPGPSS